MRNVENITILIPSNRKHLAEETKRIILPYKAEIFDGTNYPSFSKLINDCIINSTTEIVIIIADKCKPQECDIDKMIDLIHQRYGWVGMYRFGFFGFTKDLIRKIGFFDERYVGGQYEDSDFVHRMKDADIGYYESEEVTYKPLSSSWDNIKAFEHYNKKWKYDIENKVIYKLLDEEKYVYDLGEYKGCDFLKFNQGNISPKNSQSYRNFPIVHKF